MCLCMNTDYLTAVKYLTQLLNGGPKPREDKKTHTTKLVFNNKWAHMKNLHVNSLVFNEHKQIIDK